MIKRSTTRQCGEAASSFIGAERVDVHANELLRHRAAAIALPLPGSSISVFSTVHCLSACSITLPGRMVFAWIFILNFRCLISPDEGGGTYQLGSICAIEDHACSEVTVSVRVTVEIDQTPVIFAV